MKIVKEQILNSREDWLLSRNNSIGGSDASCILGLNNYKTNVDLWKIKKGLAEQEDISDKPYVKYGTEAEKYLRGLFALDFPQYEVLYDENNYWTNSKYPYLHASLDSWLIEKETGRKGILEIKTSNIINSAMYKKWDNQIPDAYYIQLLHYFIVTEFDFAILKAQLRYDYNDDIYLKTKHYKIERAEVLDDINYLLEKEQSFIKCLESNTEPSLILPTI